MILRVWGPLSSLLREIAFDSHDPGWDPPAIEQLGDVLCDFPNVFSTSKTDFNSCSLMPFQILVPNSGALVIARPHSINPILAKEVDATFNQYLAAGLIQHSTSPYSSLLVVISKKSGGVRITVTYKKFNRISKHSQLPIPLGNQVLYSLGSGRVFSLFELVSLFSLFELVLSFRQKTAKKELPLQRSAHPQASMDGSFCLRVAAFSWVVRQGHQ